MNIEKPTFKNLILDQLEIAKENNDAELAAIFHGALEQNDCLTKIINTKLTAVCSSLASTSFTLCNELAEKIHEKRKQNSIDESSPAV